MQSTDDVLLLLLPLIKIHNNNNQNIPQKHNSAELSLRSQHFLAPMPYVFQQIFDALTLQYQMLQSSEYPQQRYRFVVLLTYLAAALVNSIPVHTFSTINVTVERLFKISSVEITLNALLFTIAHPIFAFPCNWLINRYGMRFSFVVGGVFVISGVWLRLLLQEGSSVFCLLGSGLAAIGNIFILNTPSKLAISWFKSSRVNIVAFTGILFNLLSITLGAAVPGFLIKEDTGTIEHVQELLLYEAIIITVPYILLMIFFRDTPDSPPSKAARIIANQQPQDYKKLLWKLFKNVEYLKLMVAMALNYGTLTATIAILDQALAGLDYSNSSKISSNVILSAMTVGILGNPVFSYLLRKTKAYRAVSALNTFGGFYMLTLLVFAFVYQVQSQAIIITLGGLTGFFLIPLPSILILYGSELVFPIDQSSSAGYLLAASQTFGFLVGFISINFLDKTKEASQIVLFVYCGLMLISCIFSILVKQNLKKMQFSQMSRHEKQKTDLSGSLIVKQ